MHFAYAFVVAFRKKTNKTTRTNANCICICVCHWKTTNANCICICNCDFRFSMRNTTSNTICICFFYLLFFRIAAKVIKAHSADWKLKCAKTENQYGWSQNDDFMNIHHDSQNERNFTPVKTNPISCFSSFLYWKNHI